MTAMRARGSAGGARAVSPGGLIAAASVALAVAAVLSLSVGPTGITLAALPRVAAAIASGTADAATAREQLVLLDIRLPRLLLGAFVGSALAVAGAMMQGMFRNSSPPTVAGWRPTASRRTESRSCCRHPLWATPWDQADNAYRWDAYRGGLCARPLLAPH